MNLLFTAINNSIIFDKKDVLDIEKIEANYENGLMYLFIPKKEEKQKPPRLIEIA